MSRKKLNKIERKFGDITSIVVSCIFSTPINVNWFFQPIMPISDDFIQLLPEDAQSKTSQNK